MKQLVLALMFFWGLSLKAQFTVIDTSITGTTAALFGAVFTDDTTGHVVGGWSWVSGVILKTTDAGVTWNVTPVNNMLRSVFFSSRDTGYAVGEATTIMKTIDGGATWVYQNTSIVPPSFTATSVCFINNDTGFVGLTNGPSYAFLKTFDGGTTWINDVSDTVFVQSMFLVKPNTVFAINDKLAKTTDYGSTWTKQPLLPFSWSNSMFFFNDTVGFATLSRAHGSPCFNYATLVKTMDGGQTWNATDYNCDYVGTIVFPSNNIGYMLGANRQLWKTTDGGATWNYTTYTLDSTQTANNVTGYYLTCTDTNTCYVFTNDGTIIKTTNGGGNVGISESQDNSKLVMVYPNPAENQITIEFDIEEQGKIIIEIRNILGQVMYLQSRQFAQGKQSIEIDINDFPNGVYFVQLQNKNKLRSAKFIKN